MINLSTTAQSVEHWIQLNVSFALTWHGGPCLWNVGMECRCCQQGLCKSKHILGCSRMHQAGDVVAIGTVNSFSSRGVGQEIHHTQGTSPGGDGLCHLGTAVGATMDTCLHRQ